MAAERVQWRPCWCEPYKGLAFFDEVFVQADSINNPRWDRVIPVFEEEQVFVSRLMGRALKENDLVLDLGTGSGVFAIRAAKLGCRVVAADSSQRACRFAIDNLKLNQVRTAKSLKELQPGQVLVMHAQVEAEFLDTRFDAVILSPPYNPTHPHLARRVAAHASAGDIGEGVFAQQIGIVPSLLKPGGVCMGNQMTAVRAADQMGSFENSCLRLLRDPQYREQTGLIQHVRRAFGTQFSLSCIPIISTLIQTSIFLTEQYRDLQGEIDDLEEWIARVSADNPYLALVYYAIKNSGNGDIEACPGIWGDRPEESAHQRDWKYRIGIHRTVVHHTSEERFSPLPLVLADTVSSSVLSRNANRLSDDTLPPGDSIYSINVHSLIAKEVEARRLREMFSAVFLDTTPIHTTEGGIRTLTNENRIYLFEDRSKMEDSRWAPLKRDLLGDWLHIVKALQRARCGPFAHPAFCTLGAPELTWKWPEMITTEFPVAEFPSRLARDVDDAKRVVDASFRPYLNELVASSAPLFGEDIREAAGYSRSNMGSLDTADYASNDKQFKKRVTELQRRLAERSRHLSDREAGRLDLLACQTAMHEVVHEHFARRLRASRFPGALNGDSDPSMLFGIPLGALFYRPRHRYSGFPPFYKGVLWVFLIPRPPLTPMHEEWARDLIRVAWLILNGDYTARSENAMLEVSEKVATAGVLHSMAPHMGRLSVEISELRSQLSVFEKEHPELTNVPRPDGMLMDQFAVLSMLTNAAVYKHLSELPEDLAILLARQVDEGTLAQFIERIVWPAAMERVVKHPEVLKRRGDRSLAWSDLDDMQARYPRPIVHLKAPFHLPSAKGFYPLLLFALRSAMHHSYLWSLLQQPFARGLVEVSLEADSKLSPGSRYVAVVSSDEHRKARRRERSHIWRGGRGSCTGGVAQGFERV